MSDILCDASSLISLTRSCFGNALSFMHNAFAMRFFIPPSVENEIITRPLSSKHKEYALSALRLKDLMNKKIILGIDANVEHRAQDLLKTANNLFFARGKPITTVHKGEMELIALAEHLKMENILIDERTTRMLMESPFNYKKHLEKEFKVNIMLNKQNLSIFQKATENMNVIRSTELLIVAYENGFMDGTKSLKKEILHAGLYSLRYSGCAIRRDEIENFMKKER